MDDAAGPFLVQDPLHESWLELFQQSGLDDRTKYMDGLRSRHALISIMSASQELDDLQVLPN